MSLPYLLLTIVGFCALAWLQFKQTAYLRKLFEEKAPAVKASKNEITSEDENLQMLHEDNPISFPKNLKVEIETGNDIPYEYMTNG